MNSSSQNSHSGFTVLEILISMALLVIISLAIFQATNETYKLRDVISNEGEFHNSIRLSMGILQRDIELLYSPVIILPNPVPSGSPAPGATDPNLQAQTLSGDAGRVTDFWGAQVDKSGLRPARFLGTDKKMTFVSVSHIRTYKDSAESEFAKVTYEITSDKDKSYGDNNKLLLKTESPNVFDLEDDKDRFKRSYPLLHGIKSVTFKYFDRNKKDGLSSWDTESVDHKDTFPDFVEVTLDVIGPAGLTFKGTYRFRPEIPFNGLDPSS